MRILFLESEPLYDDLLPAGLRQIGCTVETVPEVLDGMLDRKIAEFQPDFALTMGWSLFPTDERLAVIREAVDRHRVPLIYWATEDPCWHERWSVPYVQKARPDLVLTICTEYVRRYAQMGLRAACLPFGYNHELYKPTAPRPEFACDIALVANFYTDNFDQLNRKRSLNELVVPLLKGGYDLKIWGWNWDKAPNVGLPNVAGKWNAYLNHRDAPAVYSSAKIVIGLQNEFDFSTNLTMRTCEVMGSGALLLASRTKAVEGLFTNGQHLVTSGSPFETLAQVSYYLLAQKEREKVAQAGQAEVRAKHTYAHRAQELLDIFDFYRNLRPLRGVSAE